MLKDVCLCVCVCLVVYVGSRQSAVKFASYLKNLFNFMCYDLFVSCVNG